MSLINNIKYSFNKRFASYHQMRIWAKYGNETRYHFQNPDISIGEFTYGIPEVAIYDLGTKLSIGKYCSIAKDVKILLGGGHPITTASQYPFYQRRKYFPDAESYVPEKPYDVTIGNDVWIGRRVTILAGVTIGDGAIIGAGAVVSKDIPPYAVAVGNPIRVIRYRTTKENIDELLKIKWWNFNINKINTLIPYMENVDKFISVCNNEKLRGG